MKILILSLVLLVAGCAKKEGDPTVAIQEAVFRYQFRHNASVGQQSDQVYFLALGDPHGKEAVDPPTEFVARFSGLRSRISRYSESARNESGWVIDKKTEEAGVIFFVHSVRMTGPDSAEAKGGYQQDKRSASGNTYHLKFGWRGWYVVSQRLDWISRKRPNQALEPTAPSGRGSS